MADGNIIAAVELAELGRAVLWAHTLDARSDPDALRAVAPDLAQWLVVELAVARNRLPVVGRPPARRPAPRGRGRMVAVTRLLRHCPAGTRVVISTTLTNQSSATADS